MGEFIEFPPEKTPEKPADIAPLRPGPVPVILTYRNSGNPDHRLVGEINHHENASG
jgi:hypothetical protein